MSKRFALPRTTLLAVVGLSLLSACTATTHRASPPTTAQSSSTTTTLPSSTVRYVSPKGRDTWPGTKLHPWRTLRHALPAMQPDQMLYVRGGDYRETLVKIHVHRGTKSRPIALLAYPGERPVVHGLVWLRQPSYWTISGINVTWDPATKATHRPMVKVTGGVGWTWEKSEIWGAQGSANMLIAGFGHKEPAKWSLTENCIHDVRPSKLIKRSSNLTIGDMSAAGPGSITRNLVFNAPGPQNVAIGSAGGGGPTDVVVEFNTFFGAGVAVAVAGDTTDLRISRNILAGVTSGILVRWNKPHGGHNLVSQNLGETTRAFLRPFADAVVGGHGNVLDNDLVFTNVSSCRGFHSPEAAALPYGRYALG